LELFLPVQGDPRRLLAVAQGRVEDQDPVCRVTLRVAIGVGAHAARAPSLSRLPVGPCGLPFLSAGYAATRPPRTIPPGGGGAEEREARTAATFRAEISTGRRRRARCPHAGSRVQPSYSPRRSPRSRQR